MVQRNEVEQWEWILNQREENLELREEEVIKRIEKTWKGFEKLKNEKYKRESERKIFKETLE